MRHLFWKYHGIGNDFLLFDLREHPEHAKALSQKAMALCDRHFGVGGDGIFLLLPDEKAAARVEIYNADGSRPEMCGNGIRCAARFLFEHGGFPETTIPLQTDAGIKECQIVLDPEGCPSMVVVRMGAPILRPNEIPFLFEEALAVSVPVDKFVVSAISMGNPHAVIFSGFSERPLDAARLYGPTLESHRLFPKKTNVEFARRRVDGSFEVGVWERGCGITLACGTGACATAVAAVLNGFAESGKELTVRLPGGDLFITVPPDFSDVLMRGPAVEVFQGEVDLAMVSTAPVPV